MESLNKVLFLLSILALIVAFFPAQATHNYDNAKEIQETRFRDYFHREPISHFSDRKKNPSYPFTYGGRPRPLLTCDKFPRVCHIKGSPGPDCCKKKCVNVKTDIFNCGVCGLKCKYPEMCCNGKCVNILHDRKHCGGCHNKCNTGSLCYYGMCSYA